jgi:F-type H+-transporting ATPase subunit delta
VARDLADFERAAADVPELGDLLRNPEVDRRVKASVLDELLVDADEFVRNFLRLLVEKGRIGELAEITHEFERLLAVEQRRLELELTTAVELSDDEAREIVAQIERSVGRTVEARREVDPALIGGVVLRVGSLRLDASVRGRLLRLREELRRATDTRAQPVTGETATKEPS